MRKNNTQYRAGITREQFMFYEMRVTAKLLLDGLSDAEIIQMIISENLYQYPTERLISGMANACLCRLHGIDDDLVKAIAINPQDEAKQVCLYAMMKDQRLVREFMVTVIGEKYRTQNLSFSKIDINSFLLRLQEQNDDVASWSEQTIRKIGQVLVKLLVDNEYLDSRKAIRLNPVLIFPLLESSIRTAEDETMLPAFNCLS